MKFGCYLGLTTEQPGYLKSLHVHVCTFCVCASRPTRTILVPSDRNRAGVPDRNLRVLLRGDQSIIAVWGAKYPIRALGILLAGRS